MSSRAAAIVALALLLGCPHATAPTTVPSEDDAVAEATPAALPACGDGTTVLADPGAALPELASMVAILELEDPQLPAALDQLAAHARAEPSALTVRSAFSIAQWSWEVPLARDALARTGFVAGELAAVHFDDAPPLWILPLGCALDDAVARLEADATLGVRDLGDAAIASPRPGSSFPFDIVVRGDAIALVAAGRARMALAAWRRRPAAIGLGATPLGSVLAQIEPAPIRLVLRPSGLVDPDASSTTAQQQRFRVGADGIFAIDASASTVPPATPKP